MKSLKITGLLILTIVLSVSCQSMGSGSAKLDNSTDSASYMIGISIGHNLKQQDIPDIDANLIAKGIAEVLNDSDALSAQAANMYLNQYFTELQQIQAKEKLEAGQKFLEENKAGEGVLVTPSGVQYKIIEEGTGKSPAAVDSVKCQFVAKTVDGTVFQNTYERGMPVEMAVARNTPGLKEAITLMREGGKYEIVIPSALGYGPRGYGRLVGPNEILIYEFELLEVIPHEYTAEEKANIEKGKQFLAANKNKSGVVETESGLQYKVITEGTGVSPEATDRVKCHYSGKLLSGNVFDSSYERNQPAEFPLNGVIAGWTEGLQLMKEGAKYEFYIPAELAYGSAGSPPRIGPFETLIFEVELIEVMK